MTWVAGAEAEENLIVRDNEIFVVADARSSAASERTSTRQR